MFLLAGITLDLSQVFSPFVHKSPFQFMISISISVLEIHLVSNGCLFSSIKVLVLLNGRGV